MEEEKYDALIREMLSSAEEKVPSGSWKAISSRLDKKPSTATFAWWPFAAAAAAIAALALFVLTPVSVESVACHDAPILLSMTEIPALDCEKLDLNIVEFPARVIPAAKIESAAEPETAAGLNAAEPLTAENLKASDKPETKKQDSASEGKTWSDQFALMAMEDERPAKARGFELEGKGLVCTNDNVNQGAGSSRMMSGSKAGGQTAAISQDGPDEFGVPVSFQVGVRYFFNEHFAVGAGLSYSLLTRTFKGNYLENNVPVIENADITHTVQYLGVPVNLYWHLTGRKATSFYVFAGGEGAKCISSKYSVAPGLKDDVDGLQWSVGTGFGVQYMLGRHMSLYFDPSVRYYFDCGQPTTIRSRKPLMVEYAAGIRFNFK